MKVLIFPALLAVAIITTPPKPFAANAGKSITAHATVRNAPMAPLTTRLNQPGKTAAPTSPAETRYTARR
jgi:hypothetical protein